MTLRIATGTEKTLDDMYSISGPMDGRIRYKNRAEHAERKHRQIIEALGAVDGLADIQAIEANNAEIIDALFLDFPDYYARVKEALDDAKIFACTSSNPRPAEPGQQSKQRTPMFEIDTGTSDGPRGPFLNYKQRAGQGMPDGSWYLREKKGEEWVYTDMTQVLRGGIVADIFATHDGQLGGTLQMGYVKFNEGSAPQRSWWASPLRAEQRPDETKGAGGGYEWQNAIMFRVAIGGGRDAALEVSGWGGYKGMTELIKQLNNGFAGNIGKCPLIQYTGFRTEGTGSKRLHVPEWVVGKWVERPACLTPQAPQIAPAPAEVAAPQPAPAPTPAPAASIPEEAAF